MSKEGKDGGNSICRVCERPLVACVCPKEKVESGSGDIRRAAKLLSKMVGEGALGRQKDFNSLLKMFPERIISSGQYAEKDRGLDDSELVEVMAKIPTDAFAVDFKNTALPMRAFLLRSVARCQQGEPGNAIIMREAATALEDLNDGMLEEKNGRQKIVEIVSRAIKILNRVIN